MGREWGGLEVYHVFPDSNVFKQQIYCSFFQIEVNGWVGMVCFWFV